MKLTDRIVVEIKGEQAGTYPPHFVAEQLRAIADAIETGTKGNNYTDCSHEILWEYECPEYGGFKMGNRSLISDAYYGAKEYFEVCSVSKEDIEKQGFDARALTKEDMERIASKMNDLVCEGCDYWNAVDGACEYWKVPKKDEEDDPRLTPQQRKELGYE